MNTNMIHLRDLMSVNMYKFSESSDIQVVLLLPTNVYHLVHKPENISPVIKVTIFHFQNYSTSPTLLVSNTLHSKHSQQCLHLYSVFFVVPALKGP